MSEIWGIDLGGTKIEGVVLPHASSIEPICRLRVPTEAEQGYHHILHQIAKLVENMAKVSGCTKPTRIGICTPGTFDRHIQAMKNCNTTVLNGKNLPKDLSEQLGMEVVVANDANCFALAEARLGAAKGYAVVFGVIMGTGVGGGIVVDGKVLNGAQGIVGEWGHNVLDEAGDMCYSGIKGCVESFISGPALEKFYAQQSGKTLKLPEIVEAYYQHGDPHARATLQRLCHYFGRALATVINILDPDAVVLGGGVGNIELLYTEGVAELKKYVFNYRLETKILKPALGDSAGVFGAAMLV